MLTERIILCMENVFQFTYHLIDFVDSSQCIRDTKSISNSPGESNPNKLHNCWKCLLIDLCDVGYNMSIKHVNIFLPFYFIQEYRKICHNLICNHLFRTLINYKMQKMTEILKHLFYAEAGTEAGANLNNISGAKLYSAPLRYFKNQ